MAAQPVEASRQNVAMTITSAASPRRPGLWRSMYNLVAQRQLIRIMVSRELWGRFKGSILGKAWPVITPLGHLVIYTFVFSHILHVRFTKDASLANFALYFMTGMIPWTAFSEAVARSTTIILEMPNLVKRVVFPVEVLPLTLVVSGVFSQIFAASVLLIASWFFNQPASWNLVLLPVVLVTQLIFTVGLCWFCAALGVYLRDLKHFMALILQAWMFTTPIAYPASAFPSKLQFMLWLNPMAGIVSDYRRIILEGHMPDWHSYIVYTATSVAVCLIGFTFFYKTQQSFADVM